LTEYDDTEGIIFLENNSFLYILTDGTDFDEADTLQVTFSDESIIEGHLCETDKETGLSVISVALKDISQKTLSAISVAELGDSYSVEQASSVIAIGSPAGERDAVMYGVVTSVSGKLSVSDAEYSLITTDIHGSGKSQGFLLDTSGKIVGLLVNPSGNESGYLRALAISQLCPLIERLSNGETSSYIGIHGITINSAKAAARSMPEGIYVESVDRDSPAMTAGIQNGDIITSLNGYTVKSVRTYMTYLQRLDAGDRVSITFSRVNLEGEYISMESTVIIKEK
jgi:serine protease Do